MLDTGCGNGDTHDRSTTSKIICGSCAVRQVVAKGRCNTCREYFRRNGYDRSAEMIDRQIRRDEAKLLLDWLRTAKL